MKIIKEEEIIQSIVKIVKESNFNLPDDLVSALKASGKLEKSMLGKEVFKILLENINLSKKEKLPLCQDCGIAVIFVELGEEIKIKGSLYKAIQEGVRIGYKEGCLRKSIVDDPLFKRINTKDNTPAVIHLEIIPGDKLKIIFLPKGGGSENMSALKMLKPSQGVEGVIDFVLETVEKAGSNPCPPIIIGLGIGGTSDYSMYLAKKALLRKIGTYNFNSDYAKLEKEILQHVNQLGIGPEGFGGIITALAVHIEYFPCHIASLPVGINLQCHSARVKEVVL